MKAGAPERPRRGDYGVDAAYVPIGLGAGGLLLVFLAALNAAEGNQTWAVIAVLSGIYLLLSTASYLYTTRRGKFAVWSRLLSELELRGDERILDMGCGRGAVLLLAARLVPRGSAVGLDLWSRSDQSGNRPEAARQNAEREGVADRVELHTGDMTAMPFEEASFDVVLSSLAIHNIKSAEGRQRAIDEATRVLKPGGRLLIADFRQTHTYAERLSQVGLTEVAERGLGWRFWYGGPWTATRLVTAHKAQL